MATREERLLRNAHIIELRKQKKSQRQIAEELNLSEALVGSVLRSSGYGGVVEGFDYHHPCTEEQIEKYAESRRRRLKENEKDRGKEFFKKYVDCGKYDFIDYLSCVDDKEGTITLKCKVCGNVLTRSLTTVRHGRFHCDACAETEREKKIKDTAFAKEELRLVDAFHKMVADASRPIREPKVSRCIVCNRLFADSREKRVCSLDCQRTYFNTRKDKRFGDRKRDRTITAKSAYKKFGGRCWICGGLCDLNDYIINEEGHFIVGNLYPSVDHVVPVYEGGEDSWENIKLAHFVCNSRRYWKEKTAPR